MSSDRELRSSSPDSFIPSPKSPEPYAVNTPVDEPLRQNGTSSSSATSTVISPDTYSDYTQVELQKDREEGLTRPLEITLISHIKTRPEIKQPLEKMRHLRECKKMYQSPLPIFRGPLDPGTGKFRVVGARPRIKSKIHMYKELVKRRQQQAETTLSFVCPECGKTVVSTGTIAHRQHMKKEHGLHSTIVKGQKYNVT